MKLTLTMAKVLSVLSCRIEEPDAVEPVTPVGTRRLEAYREPGL